MDTSGDIDVFFRARREEGADDERLASDREAIQVAFSLWQIILARLVLGSTAPRLQRKT